MATASTRRKVKATKSRSRAIVQRRVLPVDPPRSASPVNRLLLNGRRLDMQIGMRLTGARLDRTIEGANVLSIDVWDGDRAILSSGLFGRAALETNLTVTLDGLNYYLAGVSKSGDQLTSTFEDAVILKAKRDGRGKPLKTSRTAITRAAFCAAMFRQAGIPVIVLDEAVVQPIVGAAALKTAVAKAKPSAKTTNPTAPAKKTRTEAKGVSGAGITIGGSPPSQEQTRNIATVLGVAASLKAGPKATLALVEACLVEPGTTLKGGFTNPTQMVDHTSTGILQLLSSTAAGLGISATDVTACVKAFLLKGFYGKGGAIELARNNPSWSAGQIAQACQGSAFPGRYDTTRAEAVKIIAAGGGDVTGTGTDVGTTVTKDYAYERKKDESTWASAWRLLVEEVQWRLFVREGVVVIASDPTLMRARPSLTMSERSDEVETLDYDWHRAMRIGEMTGRVFVERYAADPGEVIDVDGFPPEDRRWLLSSVSIDLLTDSPLADIALRQPQPPGLEPAAETETTAADGGEVTGTAEQGTVAGLFAACKAIHDKKYPYVWGGGHAKAGTPDRGDGSDPGIGYDCSGSVVAALAAVGLGYSIGAPAPASGPMAASYGQPGKGKDVTVWANAGHVWMEFHSGDFAGYQFNTAGHPGDRGPRLLKQSYGSGGFTPRHPGGL